MAYYNANRVIKLTRKALGITQEKLSEGVCEVETYSRIENGHRTIRRSTYQKLMEKMGRNTDRRYAVCVSKDGMLLEEKIEYERAYKRYDYKKAAEYLEKIKLIADDGLLTKQYIARAEALVSYRMGQISAEKLVDELDKVIRMREQDYERLLELDDVFPFLQMELSLLINLGNAYRLCGNWEQGKKMYDAVLRCLATCYMGEPDNLAMQIIVRRNLARAYAEKGKNLEALEEIENCLNLAIENDCGYKIAALLVAKAYNYVELVNKGVWEAEKLQSAIYFLRQAYFLATARNEFKLVNTIKEYYEINFGEWKWVNQ